MGLSSSASASGKIFWGSRAGMSVTVIHMSGLSTPNAIIRTKHTHEDAISFCREYVGKITPLCIREQLAIPLNDAIEANCPAGEFTNFQGSRFSFQGENKDRKEFQPKYIIKDLANGDILDGSSASGYPVLAQIFKALCPKQAPYDIEG
ncbi:MAG: hypothetical protein KF750_06055 [Xanthobacteraceae bacterium]|nr:hypothetical protein [Xanthobacteraceae bacterium]